MRHAAYLRDLTPRARTTRALLLLTAAGVVSLAAGAAQARPSNGRLPANPDFTNPAVGAKPKTAQTPAPAPAPDDGLGPKDVYVEADNMVDDRPANTVTATGHVEVRYQSKTLRAEQVIYNTVTGAVHASGHVMVISPDGSVEYADDAQLDDQLRAGVALGFSALLQDNVTIVAHAAIRRTETVNELRSARYTACNICDEHGRPKQPVFSIEADRIIEDRDREVIYYRHAIIRVMGVPVMYFPIFWHPDPSAKRRSGFLTPKIEYSKRRGGTYEQLFNNHVKFGDDTSRSYILGKGAFDLTPNGPSASVLSA